MLADGGGYAQFGSPPHTSMTIVLSDSADDTTMAALPDPKRNRLMMMMALTKVPPGESLLVHGAAVGVGSIAV